MSEQITTPQAGEPGETMAVAVETAEAGRGALAPEFPQNYRKTIALVLIAAAGMYIMMLTLSTALTLLFGSLVQVPVSRRGCAQQGHGDRFELPPHCCGPAVPGQVAQGAVEGEVGFRECREGPEGHDSTRRELPAAGDLVHR